MIINSSQSLDDLNEDDYINEENNNYESAKTPKLQKKQHLRFQLEDY